jgi:hypothetical protein
LVAGETLGMSPLFAACAEFAPRHLLIEVFVGILITWLDVLGELNFFVDGESDLCH